MIFAVHHYPTLGSTNDEAMQRAVAGAPEGVVITADAQTLGRGRQGRAWQSPQGNLFFSLLLRPQRPKATWGQLAFIAALALVDLLQDYGIAACVKWPNDGLVNEAKISGILLEGFEDTAGSGLILGMGINVVTIPEVEGRKTTALNALLNATQAPLEARDVLDKLLPHVAKWYDLWQQQGFAPLQKAWLGCAYGLGQTLTVQLSQTQKLVGVFQTLDEDGALLLMDGHGHIQKIFAGDIFFS